MAEWLGNGLQNRQTGNTDVGSNPTMYSTMDNWEVLKKMLEEQIVDCRHYGSRFQRPYREVLKVMKAIEEGKQDELKPNNCTWKTQEEIDKFYKED